MLTGADVTRKTSMRYNRNIQTGTTSLSKSQLTAYGWTPTPEEASFFQKFDRPDSAAATWYWPGRQPIVSFILLGDDPPKAIVGGTKYLVVMYPNAMGDGMRVRRAVRVYQWDREAEHKSLQEVSTPFLLRPISAAECWAAAGGPWPLRREYNDHIRDRLRIVRNDFYQAKWNDLCVLELAASGGANVTDEMTAKDMLAHVVAMDNENQDIHSPDWELQARLPRDQRSRPTPIDRSRGDMRWS